MNLNEECLLKYLNNPQSLDNNMDNLKSYIHIELNAKMEAKQKVVDRLKNIQIAF